RAQPGTWVLSRRLPIRISCGCWHLIRDYSGFGCWAGGADCKGYRSRPRVLLRPVEGVIGHFFPAGLRAQVVRAPGEQLEGGGNRGQAVLPMRRLHHARRDGSILLSRDQEQGLALRVLPIHADAEAQRRLEIDPPRGRDDLLLVVEP